MTEDQIGMRIDLERFLGGLSEERRTVLLLVYKLERPSDWPFAWPPKSNDVIGEYVGHRFRTGPLGEATVRYIARQARRQIRRDFGIPDPADTDED